MLTALPASYSPHKLYATEFLQHHTRAAQEHTPHRQEIIADGRYHATTTFFSISFRISICGGRDFDRHRRITITLISWHDSMKAFMQE